MANRTDTSTIKLFGSNPQYLISNIIRSKIYDSLFWKEKCFAVTAESIIDLAVSLKYVGGTYGGNRKPTPFLCLVLKLLQIQPDKEIIYEYIKNEEFLYLRALGCFYFRLVGKSVDVYKYLEPVLADYRKIKVRLTDGRFEKMYMDEFVDNCLVLNNFLDVDFPSLTKRQILEENQLLQKRASDCHQEFWNSFKKERQKLEEEQENDDEDEKDEKDEEEEKEKEAENKRKPQDKEDGLKKKRKKHRFISSSTSSLSGRQTSPTKRENKKRRSGGWKKDREGRQQKYISREKERRKKKEERDVQKDISWLKSWNKDRDKHRDKHRNRNRRRERERERESHSYSSVEKQKRSNSYEELYRKKKSSRRERISRSKESSSSKSGNEKAYEKKQDKKGKPKQPDIQHYAESIKGKNDNQGDEKKNKNSVEEWNKIRSKLGMKPLK